MTHRPNPCPARPAATTAAPSTTSPTTTANFYDCNITKLDTLNKTINAGKARQQRLKHSSRQWRKEQAKIRKAHRDIANIKDNWEHHTAKAIAENNDVVIVEQLRHTDMRQGTRGTPENPSNNAAQKRGLNRTLSNARPGAMQQKLQRHCQKTGSNYLKVNPAGTSITCYSCGHRDRKNRKTQGLFLCLRCLIAVNADENAARNIRRRGLQLILLYLLMSTWSYVPNPKDRRVGIPSLDGQPAQCPDLTWWTLVPAVPGETGGTPGTATRPSRRTSAGRYYPWVTSAYIPKEKSKSVV